MWGLRGLVIKTTKFVPSLIFVTPFLLIMSLAFSQDPRRYWGRPLETKSGKFSDGLSSELTEERKGAFGGVVRL